MTQPATTTRLIIVSNRLPFVFRRDAAGEWEMIAGSGGLVTALLPVLRSRGGTWIGWTGAAEDSGELDHVLPQLTANRGYDVKPVALSSDEVQRFYMGFSNEIIWPLFHDLQSLCNFDPTYWNVYQQVNKKYAAVVATTAQPDDLIWIHDYHLMNVALELRAMGVRSRLAFFLHIPFPSPDIFLNLPWRAQLLRALLEFDLIGFQTPRDRRNFVQCLRHLLPDVPVRGNKDLFTAQLGARTVTIGSFPISIDYADFRQRVTRAKWPKKRAICKTCYPIANSYSASIASITPKASRTDCLPFAMRWSAILICMSA